MPEKFEKGPTNEPIIPVGKGREVEKAIRDYRESSSIFEKVKNKVVFVNSEVNIPLKLEEGKESPLALFFKADVPGEYVEKDGEKKLETLPEHLRSAILGRVIFSDKEVFSGKEGRLLYRDIDLKGSGSISEREEQKTGKPYPFYGYYGLLESKNTFDEHKISEEFLSKGIRTFRVLAIINLEEIIVEGEKISLEKAREKGIIAQEFQPVIEVRAFGTKARIADVISEALPEEIRKLILEDAKTLVSQETGKDLSNDEDYLGWFAETLGQNVGLLHKNGYYHSNLGGHNITLDCRIVDPETVTELISACDKWSPFNKWPLIHDKAHAISSFSILAEQLVLSKGITEEVRDELLKQYNRKIIESYDAVFSPEERR